jgi:hypothetical protein
MPAKNVVIKGISLDPKLLEVGLERARELGFRNSFSAYIQKLIEDDSNVRINEVSQSFPQDNQSQDAARPGAGGVFRPEDHPAMKYPKPSRRKIK